MQFRVIVLGIKSGGKQIIVLDNEDASLLGIHSSDRVEVQFNERKIIENIKETDLKSKQDTIDKKVFIESIGKLK